MARPKGSRSLGALDTGKRCFLGLALLGPAHQGVPSAQKSLPPGPGWGAFPWDLGGREPPGRPWKDGVRTLPFPDGD